MLNASLDYTVRFLTAGLHLVTYTQSLLSNARSPLCEGDLAGTTDEVPHLGVLPDPPPRPARRYGNHDLLLASQSGSGEPTPTPESRHSHYNFGTGAAASRSVDSGVVPDELLGTGLTNGSRASGVIKDIDTPICSDATSTSDPSFASRGDSYADDEANDGDCGDAGVNEVPGPKQFP